MNFLRVALVGPDQQENLALQYLASSVKAAGHAVDLVRFSSRQDLGECVRAVITSRPDLVGQGISFQYAVQDYMDLARALRESGFQGHITCGGHVPTFCFRELLRDEPAIDTAVRHEGEQTLVELLALLAAGGQAHALPGLVWRERGGIEMGPARPPTRDLDALPEPRRRQTPLRVGGVPVAFVISARGCFGECAY
jgi:radical SAM superfamily enzyme YgiQ (UPF0313 family)